VVALRDGERSVNTLAEVVGKSPAAVSQHLAKLRLTRMVTTRHEGTRVFYRLANEHA
jgi:DNA-binding transcriptional ArsR family regulator